MDARRAFLEAATSLLAGYLQLTRYRLVGNTATICILDVNVKNKNMYAGLTLPCVNELRLVTPQDYAHFSEVFHESSKILAFSWLESFVDEVEEALYLSSPASLGESVQVKLGKILEVATIEELLHDIARRRVRERSQWSLGSRIKDLREHHSFEFSVADKEIEWLSHSRNNIIHNRRMGQFKVSRKRITYEVVQRQARLDDRDTPRFLDTAVNLVVDLYEGTCKSLEISNRQPLHRMNKKLMSTWRNMWKVKGIQSSSEAK